MKTAAHRTALMAIAGVLVAACAGIPLTSLPRLAALNNELLHANPAEFMLAVQTDERMVPPAGTVPMLIIEIRPGEAGAFEPVDRKLPMRLSTISIPAGLPRAAAGRRWLIYSLGPESVAELTRIQTQFTQIQARAKSRGGVSLGIGIAQEGIASGDPRVAHTAWQSWLQVSRSNGFFELWSGTLSELKEQARAHSR